MPRHCEQCDAELIGAVNRCWKCGVQLNANQTSPEPNAPDQTGESNVLMAQTVDGSNGDGTTRDAGSKWIAIAAIIIGGIAIPLSWFSGAGIAAAVVGLVFAISGRRSAARKLATIAMVLCILALVVGSLAIAYELYFLINGAPLPSNPAGF